MSICRDKGWCNAGRLKKSNSCAIISRDASLGCASQVVELTCCARKDEVASVFVQRPYREERAKGLDDGKGVDLNILALSSMCSLTLSGYKP